MRVLMISGDPNLRTPGTAANRRFMLQAAAVDALELIVWPKEFFKPFFIRGPFDVVTSQDPFWRGLVAWVAAARLHATLNLQVHADLDAQSLVKYVLSQIVLRHAHSVRVVSNKIKEQVSRLTKAPVSVLPVFIDISRYKNITREPHPRFAKTILWIGRFEDEKDPLQALNVLAQVRAAGIDAGLVMLGSGSLAEHLRGTVADAGLRACVEFPGWQDPAAFIKYADVVLCTSKAESFGASIVEALAAGVCVVAPDVGIAREAGAIIATKQELAQKTIEVLRGGMRGSLLLSLPDEAQWAAAWKKTLE